MASCECVNMSTVSSPEACLDGLRIEKELGHGDFGVAYELKPGDQNQAINAAISETGKYVLKQIKLEGEPLSDEQRQGAFIQESCLGKNLADLGIAPKIYKCWSCSSKLKPSSKKPTNFGYIVMDKMDGTWKDKYNLTRGNKEHQFELIHALAIMVKNGFLHQDCHVGNIGFVNDKVVLFDFGLTVEIKNCRSPCNNLPLLLASQLNIVVEQFPITEKLGTTSKRNYIFDLIYHIFETPDLTIDNIIDIARTKQFSEIPKQTVITKSKAQLPSPYSEQKTVIRRIIAELPCNVTSCKYIPEALLLEKLYKETTSYSPDNYDQNT